MDFKNVQRRVYDALNVFSALNIVMKLKNKVSITEHGMEYLTKDGSNIPIRLEPLRETQNVAQKVLEDSPAVKALKVGWPIWNNMNPFFEI